MEERYTDRRMPKLVNIDGAAEILGVVPQYAYRLAERGQLPGAKIGHAWIFRRVAVERLRDQRTPKLAESQPAVDDRGRES